MWETLVCLGFALARSACSASVPSSYLSESPCVISLLRSSQAVPAIKFLFRLLLRLLLRLYLLPSIWSSQRGQEAGQTKVFVGRKSRAISVEGGTFSKGRNEIEAWGVFVGCPCCKGVRGNLK